MTAHAARKRLSLEGMRPVAGRTFVQAGYGCRVEASLDRLVATGASTVRGAEGLTVFEVTRQTLSMTTGAARRVGVLMAAPAGRPGVWSPGVRVVAGQTVPVCSGTACVHVCMTLFAHGTRGPRFVRFVARHTLCVHVEWEKACRLRFVAFTASLLSRCPPMGLMA